MQRRAPSLSRFWQIRRAVRKHGLVSLLDDLELPRRARLGLFLLFGSGRDMQAERGISIRLALEELGPVFIKLGQALSTRPDLLPADVAEELAKLQDRVPPFAGEQALTIIRECYGEEFDRIFASVEQEPLASASVAQVHAATLQPGLALEGKNGKHSDQVVIKVIRPGAREVIDRDLDAMYFFADKLQRYWQRGRQFKPLQVIREYDGTISGELDLRREAANCSQMGANFAQTDIIYVPQIYWDYTHQNVFVMERIYGTSVRDVEQLKALGYDLKQLASDGVETFFKQAFEDNFFHADMHPGNIFVSDQGKWIAIDFGIMGVLNESDKRYLAEMLLGFFNRDYRSIAESHLRAGWIPPDTQLSEFETAIRMVCEPNFAKPISEISFGMVLMQLFQTVQRFEMPVQPQLVLLYKTLLNIEGLGRQLYPQLNLWDTAKPFLENWMKQQLSPQALLQDIKRNWPRWREVLAELPDHLRRLEEQSKLSAAEPSGEPSGSPSVDKDHGFSARNAFHMTFGFVIALASLLLSAGIHAQLLPAFDSFEWLPMVGIAGLLWAWLGARS